MSAAAPIPAAAGVQHTTAATPVEKHVMETHDQMAKKALPPKLYKFLCQGGKEISFLPVFYAQEIVYQDTRPRRSIMPGAVGEVLTYDSTAQVEKGHLSVHYTALKIDHYRPLSSFFEKMPPDYQKYAPTEELTVEQDAVTVIDHFDGRNDRTYIEGSTILVEPTVKGLKAYYDRVAIKNFEERYKQEINDPATVPGKIFAIIQKITLNSPLFFFENYENLMDNYDYKSVNVSITRRITAAAEDVLLDKLLPEKESEHAHFAKGPMAAESP